MIFLTLRTVRQGFTYEPNNLISEIHPLCGRTHQEIRTETRNFTTVELNN